MIGIRKLNEREAKLRTIDGKLFFANETGAVDSVFPAIPYMQGDIILAAWAEIVGACNSGAGIDLGYTGAATRWGQFLDADTVGQCQTIVQSTATLNPTEIADKTSETFEFEVVGARVGDLVSITSDGDLADLAITADVIHPDFVRITLSNNTGGEVDLVSQTITITLNKAPLAGQPFVAPSSGVINVTTKMAVTQGIVKVSALIYRK